MPPSNATLTFLRATSPAPSRLNLRHARLGFPPRKCVTANADILRCLTLAETKCLAAKPDVIADSDGFSRFELRKAKL
jgi:hypothetical protein